MLVRVKLTKENFVDRAKNVHGNLYNYDLVQYDGFSHKVKILCHIHGVFEQTPRHHIQLKTGCPHCARERRKISNRREISSKEKFVAQSQLIHHNKYSYEDVIYVSAHTKVIITCPIHGQFMQRPNDHLSGYGCYQCGHRGVYNEEYFRKYPETKMIPSSLYLIKFLLGDETFLKIGVTTKSLDIRFNNTLLKNATIIQMISLPAYRAYQVEQQILDKYVKLIYYPKNLPLSIGGHHECFRMEALNQILKELEIV